MYDLVSSIYLVGWWNGGNWSNLGIWRGPFLVLRKRAVSDLKGFTVKGRWRIWWGAQGLSVDYCWGFCNVYLQLGPLELWFLLMGFLTSLLTGIFHFSLSFSFPQEYIFSLVLFKSGFAFRLICEYFLWHIKREFWMWYSLEDPGFVQFDCNTVCSVCLIFLDKMDLWPPLIFYLIFKFSWI